jgi:transcriptional regulator with XRE-family HTH domain
MSSQQTPLLWSPTHGGTESAAISWMSSPASRVVLLAAGALTASCLFVMPDLATPVAFFAREITSDHAVGSTSPASPETPTFPSSSARLIRDLKSRSGLTWDQLAGVFGVSRRAAHGWASGARLNAQHSETLSWLRQTLTRLEVPADPDSTRAALLEVVASARRATPTDAILRTDFSPFDRVSVRHENEKWLHDRGEVIAMVDSD